MAAVPVPHRFCWSKMGTEAGQTLDRILIRKEFERRANGGYFLWGVGNSVMAAIEDLFRLEPQPRIVFSRMKSKPKAIDVQPGNVFVWLGAETAEGVPCELPAFSLITSRGDSDVGPRKRGHYALFCYSEQSLLAHESWTDALDAASLVNLRTGRPLGASQVTSVVSRGARGQEAHLQASYSVDVMASLARPGQVRLTQPSLLGREAQEALEQATVQEDFDGWVDLVRQVRAEALATTVNNRCSSEQRELLLA